MKIPIDPLKVTPLVTFLYKLWIRTLFLDDQGGWKKFLSLHEAGIPHILCLWHEDIFAITGYGYTKTRDLVTCVSQSRDGELIDRVLHNLGHITARASSSRGGVRALVQIRKIMERENRMAVFTLDGPRGPRHIPKPGPIFLAQHTGARIVPCVHFPCISSFLIGHGITSSSPIRSERVRYASGPLIMSPPRG